MTAYMVLDGDPDKVDVAGYTFGDILAADATGTLTAVAVGADTEVLTADSTQAAGVDWAAGGGGGAVTEVLFTSVAGPAYQDGKLVYDSDVEANTLTFFNTEAGTEIHFGREIQLPVRNNTGSTITGGQAVYISGNHPGTMLPTIALARADAATTAPCIGIAAHDIEVNTNGFVYAVGLAHHNINTAAFSNGDILYLSASVAGELTATPPASPNYKVRVGFVARASAGSGAIYVLPSDVKRDLVASSTSFVESGNIAAATASFTALGPAVTVSAETGDILELTIDSMLCNNTGGDLQVDAATRVAAADTNWWSSGTGTSRFPGGLGCWYVETSRFDSPRCPARYTVQAGDVSSGQVTVQLYGRASGSARTVFANSSYPLRWWVTNLSAGV